MLLGEEKNGLNWEKLSKVSITHWEIGDIMGIWGYNGITHG